MGNIYKVKKAPVKKDRHKGKMFGVRLSEDMAEWIRETARIEMRPFSNVIALLIVEAIQARIKKGEQ